MFCHSWSDGADTAGGASTFSHSLSDVMFSDGADTAVLPIGADDGADTAVFSDVMFPDDIGLIQPTLV